MKKINRLAIIAFISGMTITAIEISAARLLGPYFGTSLLVWTNIIGIVLIALAVGYSVGGRISEKHPEPKILLRIILTAGWLCLLAPWIVRPLALAALPQNVSNISSSFFIVIGSFGVCAILFGAPIALLGMASPFLIKLSTLHSTKTGRASGDIFAWSTAGSIFGTFTPTFLFIPTLGTRNTISLFAGMLIVLGSFGFIDNRKKLIIIALIVPFFYPTSLPIKPNHKLLEEKESIHQYIQVTQNSDGTRAMSINEGLGIQSLYNPYSALTNTYHDLFLVLPALFPDKDHVNILIVGLAGGTIARSLYLEYGDRVKLEAVEIDPAMTNLAKKYFDLGTVPITIHHADGRIFLQETGQKYDIIIVDAYQNEMYIPWTMTTQEFWRTVQQKLTPGGMAAANLSAISKNSKLYQAFTNTVAKVFPYISSTPSQNLSSNYLILASDGQLNLLALTKQKSEELTALGQYVASHTQNIQLTSDKMILTDDRAPIELFTDEMIFKYLGEK